MTRSRTNKATQVSVAIPHYATFRQRKNFTKPDSFLPDRWMDKDGLYPSDRREVLQPFSFGPRACIGRK